VWEAQKIRREIGSPVTVVGTSIKGPAKNRVYHMIVKISGSEQTISLPWRKKDMRVYGFNASLPDRIMGIMKHDFDQLVEAIRDGSLGYNNATALMAMLQLDYKEEPDNDTVFGVEKGLNNVPWCAIFYHWCRDQVCSIVDRNDPVPFEPALSNSRKTFEGAPVQVTDLRECKSGYAIVWEKTDSPVSGHTGICIHNDPVNMVMTLIEPNYSNKVTLRKKGYNSLNRGKLRVIGACSYWKDDNNVGDFMDKINLSSGTFLNSSDLGVAITR